MLSKLAALIGFAAGAYLGYRFVPELLASWGIVGDTEYWTREGIGLLHSAATLFAGIIVGTVAYFLAQFFRRFE